mgnify:FL=1
MEELKMYLPLSTKIEDGIKKVLKKAEQINQRVVAEFNGFLIDSNYSYSKNLELFEEHFKRPTPKKDYRNWEQRRYEIAKTMLPAIYTDDGNAARADHSPINGFEYKTLDGCCREAVRFADTLIKELQKKETENEND